MAIEVGFCQCGCGQRTNHAPHTDKNKGWKKGEPLRYIHGHRARGLKWDDERKAKFSRTITGRKMGPLSPEHRAKLSALRKGKKLSERHRQALIDKHPYLQKGPANPLWKGTEAHYARIHQWMLLNHAKTGVCESCGETKKTAWANKDHTYRRIREDWLELCPKCHRAYDTEHNPRR